ncbi:MAG: aminopeptidase [Erysipelotrichaceae bacterium]|nr:aminopeptidase [Erysipelotrichaceae bacterium]
MKKSVLKKYAKLIATCGVNVQKGQEVIVNAAVDQVPLVKEVVEACYKRGAKRVTVEWGCSEVTKVGYKYMSVETMSEIPQWQIEKMKRRVEVIPARIHIASGAPDAMKGVDQKKLAQVSMKTYPIMKPYIDQIDNKDQWCIAGAASPEWAKKVFPDLPKKQAVEKLWEAILYTSRIWDDPVAEWKKHNKDLREKCERLNNLGLVELRYKSSNGTDFKVGLLPNANFLGGSEFALGSGIEFNPNVPSEECFTSPRKGAAEGLVVATKPLSYQGELIENFSIRFENGKAVEVHAEKGEELLKQMISMDENAGYLGEVALIPYDSPINNTGILFYNTLYDENASCHLALGRGFTNCIRNYDQYSQKELQEMGINSSMIHVDFMIGSEDMDIVGVKEDGTTVQIFKNGNWAF